MIRISAKEGQIEGWRNEQERRRNGEGGKLELTQSNQGSRQFSLLERDLHYIPEAGADRLSER